MGIYNTYMYSQGRIQDLAMGGGGARFVGKRVTYTSEVSYERSEYKSAGGTGIFFEFRTPESESERNLTNYFIIFLLLFY